MPVHDASGSNQDQRLPPPGPERSQRHPEQLVQGSQSSARPLRVQSEQLPTESQVFEDEVLAGAKRADDPPEEMPERHNHGKNIIGTIRIQLCAKSFILQVYDVLARHTRCGACERSSLREERVSDEVSRPRRVLPPMAERLDGQSASRTHSILFR